jgi:protein-disulfide isomerase
LKLFSRLLPVVLLAASIGCSAQQPAPGPLPTQVKRRIVNNIRERFNLPPDVDITVGEAKAGEFPGYEEIAVTLEKQSKDLKKTYRFLLSNDYKHLVQWDDMDISSEPVSKLSIAGRPSRGNANAPVTIIGFDDLQCPFCSQMNATLFQDIKELYGDDVRVIYKDYPIETIHPWAMHAAVDSNCLLSQNEDAYWGFIDWVHAHYKDVTGDRNAKDARKLQIERVDNLATDYGNKYKLDSTKLQACLKAQDETKVRASLAEGEALGIDSTPTLFINGERMSGALPPEIFLPIINRALRDAGRPIPEKATKALEDARKQAAEGEEPADVAPAPADGPKK